MTHHRPPIMGREVARTQRATGLARRRRYWLAALLLAGAVCSGAPLGAEPRPKVTFVGFQQFEDGSARLFVHMSGEPADVSQQGEGKHVEIVLRRMDVGVRNNQNPLVFEHFDTALLRAQLRPRGDDVVLVLELRRPVQLRHAVQRRADGEVLLQVDVPPS